MTRTFLATESNDLGRDHAGNLAILRGAAGITQVARQAMQTRRSEMLYDQPDGIPFDILVWEGSANIAQFEAAGRRRLRQVDGVRDIISFEATMAGDTLKYVAVIQTDLGEVSVTGQL